MLAAVVVNGSAADPPVLCSPTWPNPPWSYGCCATLVTQYCCDFTHSPPAFKRTKFWTSCQEACKVQLSVCIAQACSIYTNHYYRCNSGGSNIPCSPCVEFPDETHPANEGCKPYFAGTPGHLPCTTMDSLDDFCYGNGVDFWITEVAQCGAQ